MGAKACVWEIDKQPKEHEYICLALDYFSPRTILESEQGRNAMDADLWLSTLQFALGGILLYLPLFWLLPDRIFRNSRRAVVMGASLFWLGFTAILVNLAWGYYYRFFYPAWMRWGTALIAFALYSVYAFGCHRLASRLPGQPMLWFCFFTGLLAANEHYIAWNFLHLPEKVPMLTEMPLIPTMLFAFFEYQVYWASALWIAWILLKLSTIRRRLQFKSSAVLVRQLR